MSDIAKPAIETDEISALRAHNDSLEMALRETKLTADRRLIHAELKSEALRNGIVDLDGLKLIDPHDVTVDESGVVKGAASVIGRLQRDKPWLFNTGNSSSLATAPPSAPSRTKLATEMTLDEWRAARIELLRRR
jgi:hypothetical protein